MTEEPKMTDLSAKLDARPATFTCDKSKVGPLYYFAVADRAPGPYKTQRHVEAIIDIADDGTLAGVELIDSMPPPPLAMSNPVSVGDDLVERSISGETVAGLTVLGWMTEAEIPGIGLTRKTDYHWSTPGAGKKVTRLVDAADAASQLTALRHDNSDLLAAADADAYTIATLEAQLKAARDLVEFVHRWTWGKEGNGTTDAERLDVIKHYPPIAALNPKAPS